MGLYQGPYKWAVVNEKRLSVYKGGLGVLKHAKGSNAQGGALADPVMRHGHYTFTFVIERGDAGNFVGAGLYLGVADATSPFTTDHANDTDHSGDAWAYYPKSGQMKRVDTCMGGHYTRTTYTACNVSGLPSLDSSATINGARVTFRVDMERCCFSVSVNDELPF